VDSDYRLNTPIELLVNDYLDHNVLINNLSDDVDTIRDKLDGIISSDSINNIIMNNDSD
jgi:hypothetical protein